MRLRHPRLEGVTETVADEHIQDWLDQGWVQDEPDPAPEPTEPAHPARTR